MTIQLNALDRYRARKAQGSPGLNPPEAEKLIEKETVPETEAHPVAVAPVAATVAPVESASASDHPQQATSSVVEPEKKTRGRRAASNTAAPAAGESVGLSSVTTEQLRDELVARGWKMGLGT